MHLSLGVVPYSETQSQKNRLCSEAGGNHGAGRCTVG